MSITSKIIADSVNPWGIRLTSFILTYSRYIHSEIGTHRVFSRSSASSRAIPFKKSVEAVMTDPAIPVQWGVTARGMQSKTSLEGDAAEQARAAWLSARDDAVKNAEAIFEKHKLHKQLINRLLEPWAHMTTLLTGTEFHNFFALRASPEAQPEFAALAFKMLSRYLSSTPKQLAWGGYHVPFGDRTEGLDMGIQLKVATARAARVSYLTFEGDASVEDDCRLHDQLLESGHMSPFEHAAQAKQDATPSNFGAHSGWNQYRKQFPLETKRDVDLKAILATKPSWIDLEDGE